MELPERKHRRHLQTGSSSRSLTVNALVRIRRAKRCHTLLGMRVLIESLLSYQQQRQRLPGVTALLLQQELLRRDSKTQGQVNYIGAVRNRPVDACDNSPH